MGDEPPPPAIDADNSPFPLTDIDRLVLSQTDEEFKRHDWEELKEIIRRSHFLRSYKPGTLLIRRDLVY